MIHKLQKSFVRVTMVSAALVLVILMGIVNISNYVQRNGTDAELLQILADNNGRFPGDGKGGKSGHRFITEETPYETRYFSVLLSEDGSFVWPDTTQIAAVAPEEAVSIAQSLLLAGKTSGYYKNYKFTVMTYDGGYVRYVFLDCSRNLFAVRQFFLNSLIVTAAGLAVLFGLAWALSKRAVRPIAESYEKQKAFITNAGHELKTPLAVIGSSTDVIELETGETQWTKSIHSQVERMTELTAQLIALARMDESSAQLVMEDLDLSAVTAEVLEPFAMLAERNGLSFSADIAPDIRLKANRDAVEKICAILADNAVKYTVPGGDIRFTLTREGGKAVLREENPAEGLAAGKQEKLFDRFYRADASRSSTQPGYGLGLPLARSLAEAMGGSLTAVSPDGKRLIFTAHFTA